MQILGITIVVIIGIAALIGIIFLLRVFNGWFFKINEIITLLREIRDRPGTEEANSPPSDHPME